MATSNFYTENCSRYYVIGTAKYFTQEDIDANDWDPEMLGEYDEDGTRLDYEYERDNIFEGLQAIGWEQGEGETLATYTEYLCYGGCNFSLVLKVQINSGYYEGACMDFDGSLEVYDNNGQMVDLYDAFGNYAPTEDDVREDNWTGLQGLSNMQARNIIKYLSSVIADRANQAEKVFSQFAEYELCIVGRFNSGEALYGKIEKRLCEA